MACGEDFLKAMSTSNRNAEEQLGRKGVSAVEERGSVPVLAQTTIPGFRERYLTPFVQNGEPNSPPNRLDAHDHFVSLIGFRGGRSNGNVSRA